jgi:phosphoserine phosphatase RsbU/P
VLNLMLSDTPTSEDGSSSAASPSDAAIDRTCGQGQLRAVLQRNELLFHFLHKLSMSGASEKRVGGNLYRFIAEAALKVMGATGAALYLHDESRKELVPRCLTEDCSFLVELSEEYVQRMLGERDRILAELRIMPVAVEGTFLGKVLKSLKPSLLHSLKTESFMEVTSGFHPIGSSLLLAPMLSGDKAMGVLALTLSDSPELSAFDLEVFKTLAEQSAYAILNAQLHEDAKKGRLAESEFRNAQEVQRVLQPDGDPEVEGYIVCGKNRAARHLSGDFYDYVWPDADHFGGVIADVSGKGLPAALVAASASRSPLSEQAPTQRNPGRSK